MASFFSKYPKMIINNKLVTDIISRTFVREKYSSKLSLYYPYDLQEGDTPEIIAAKYYGDPERHWIVMLANDIVDPFFDFSMDSQVFEKYIEEKYEDQANSINQWASSNWRAEWTNAEYAIVNGVSILETDENNITYSEDGSLEYIYDANTGITYTIAENGPDDYDSYTTYFPGDSIVYSNTAFICTKTHPAKDFLKDLSNGYWERIYDGVYWKGAWQTNTDYYKDDVVQHNDTIYICTQDNLDNPNNHVLFSDGEFWKTYTNGVEYATVTENPAPFTYRALIVATDLTTDTSTTTTIYIDKKSFNATYDDYQIFNYIDNSIESNDISVVTTKEKLTIFQYESEVNERKRQIKLIKKEYVPQIEKELKTLMETYYG
jgi:hypothetical protein